MNRIQTKRTRVQPARGCDPTRRGTRWDKLRPQNSKFELSREYPPDDGYANRTWSRNVLCVPCKYASRKAGWLCRHPRAHWAQKCPQCRTPLMAMSFKFSVPQKQDRWWTSPEALNLWQLHLRCLEGEVIRKTEHEARRVQCQDQ